MERFGTQFYEVFESVSVSQPQQISGSRTTGQLLIGLTTNLDFSL